MNGLMACKYYTFTPYYRINKYNLETIIHNLITAHFKIITGVLELEF